MRNATYLMSLLSLSAAAAQTAPAREQAARPPVPTPPPLPLAILINAALEAERQRQPLPRTPYTDRDTDLTVASTEEMVVELSRQTGVPIGMITGVGVADQATVDRVHRTVMQDNCRAAQHAYECGFEQWTRIRTTTVRGVLMTWATTGRNRRMRPQGRPAQHPWVPFDGLAALNLLRAYYDVRTAEGDVLGAYWPSGTDLIRSSQSPERGPTVITPRSGVWIRQTVRFPGGAWV